MATKILENKGVIEFKNPSDGQRYLNIAFVDRRFRVVSGGTTWLTKKNARDLIDWLESRLEEIEAPT